MGQAGLDCVQVYDSEICQPLPVSDSNFAVTVPAFPDPKARNPMKAYQLTFRVVGEYPEGKASNVAVPVIGVVQLLLHVRLKLIDAKVPGLPSHAFPGFVTLLTSTCSEGLNVGLSRCSRWIDQHRERHAPPQTQPERRPSNVPDGVGASGLAFELPDRRMSRDQRSTTQSNEGAC